MRLGRYHIATWIGVSVAVITFALYTAALALPQWSKQSKGTVLVLGSGDVYYGPFEICVQAANVRTCASLPDQITGGTNAQSLCDIYSSNSYCSKSMGVRALMVVCIFSSALCTLLLGYHIAQTLLHVVAAVCGLVTMSLWLSLQASVNKDTSSSTGSLTLGLCMGLLVFSWLANASAAVLTMWGGRGVHIIPMSSVPSQVAISSSQA